MKAKKLLMCVVMLVVMGSMTVICSCGDNSEGVVDETTQVTEETVHAADPMTEDEMKEDDSEGCIEDSDDLLY